MKLSLRFQVLFLLFVVLGVFYPAIFGGVNSVDDHKMLVLLEDVESQHLKQMFIPGDHFYYRPLLMLSFFLDKYLWGLEPSFMHLGNVLIHGVNTLLVFLVARKALVGLGPESLSLPLFSSLLFAVHPINTESVNWISGRTDLLATLFVLLSLKVLIGGVEKRKYHLVFLAALIFVAGVMSKEVVLFFLPAGCFLIWRWPRRSECGKDDAKGRFLSIVLFAAPFIFGGIAYLSVRIGSYGVNDGGVLMILNRYDYDLFNTVRVSYKVFGFYVKKLFVPVPLNFAIVKVSDHYVWLGLVAFFMTVIMAFKRRISTVFLVVAFYLILPAIIIALANVTWTPLAERYLYLPSAFFSVGIAGVLYQLFQKHKKGAAGLLLITLILFPAAWASAQRSLLWQDNLSLYQDTLQKTPEFASIRNELAVALIEQGRNSEAEEQLMWGKSLDPSQGSLELYINHAKVKLEQNKPEEARQALLEVVQDKAMADSEVLKMLAKVDEQSLLEVVDVDQVRKIQSDLLDTYEHLWPKTMNPVTMYRGGQMALFLGEQEKAADYFAKAYAHAPESAYYKQAAKKLAEKLAKE